MSTTTMSFNGSWGRAKSTNNTSFNGSWGRSLSINTVAFINGSWG